MKNSRGTSLFMTELIIMSLIFIACAVICVGISASARNRTDSSRDLDRATELSQSAASCYKAALGNLDDTAALLGGEGGGDELELFYDESLDLCSESEADFVLTLSETGSGNSALISVSYPEGETIFEMETGALSYAG